MGLTYPPEWKFDTDGVDVPAALRNEVLELAKKIANGSQDVIETFKARFGVAATTSWYSWALTDLASALESGMPGAEFVEALWLAIEEVRAPGVVVPTLVPVNKLLAKHGLPYQVAPPTSAARTGPSPPPVRLRRPSTPTC